MPVYYVDVGWMDDGAMSTSKDESLQVVVHNLFFSRIPRMQVRKSEVSLHRFTCTSVCWHPSPTHASYYILGRRVDAVTDPQDLSTFRGAEFWGRQHQSSFVIYPPFTRTYPDIGSDFLPRRVKPIFFNLFNSVCTVYHSNAQDWLLDFTGKCNRSWCVESIQVFHWTRL
jgi:hypothetical protein